MLKMRRGQGNRHFQISKTMFMDMEAGVTVGYRDRLLTPMIISAMRNSGKNFLHSGVTALSMLSATPVIGEVTALDRYVAAPDPSYRYELIETIPGDGYAAHVLEMTSQRWRDETEVDRPLWKHWLTVIEPEQVAAGTALLIVGGGSNERKPPARANPLLAMGAVTTRSVIAELRMVPNQPLTFVGETEQRSEDAIIAFSWDKYLRTGD